MIPSHNDSALSVIMEHLVSRWSFLPVKSLLPAFPMLAKGRPVPIDDLAAALNTEVPSLREELRGAPVEWNDKEELINVFGFKLAPTFHRLEFNGIVTFGCCALWLHFLPRLVGDSAKVESLDPVSRMLVRLSITPSGVESIEPESAVATLTRTTLEGLQADTGNNFCNHVRLFTDTESAREWIAADVRRFQVDLQTIDRIAQQMCTDIWFEQD